MIEKLRKNFNLSNVLARTFFVLAFVFANWQNALTATVLVLNSPSIWLAFAVSAVLGIAIMFLLPVLVNFALNLAKIYTVPRAEYCLLAHTFFAIGYIICGLLRLVNLFTPLMIVWGGVLFPFISSLIAAILFFKVTAKLYFNDVTVLNYYKVFVIAYFIIVFVLEVLW